MNLDRRAMISGAASSALLLPLAGCDSPPEKRTSVENVELDREDAKRIQSLIQKKLELDIPSNVNELGRLLFSLNPATPDVRLDMQGPLMRIYIEFYINNVPNLLEKYRAVKLSNDVLLAKRDAFSTRQHSRWHSSDAVRGIINVIRRLRTL